MPLRPVLPRLRAPEGISRLMRDLIHERTGLYFEDTRTDALLEKLEPLGQARGLDSFLEYYYLLKDNGDGAWEEAWDVLSVQETYFWREMSAIDALTRVIVPEWFAKRSLPFRIWSAACATGEEPYSIVMALAEAGLGGLPIEVTASDASAAAIQKAAQAVYREKSFRTLPLDLRQKYFQPVAGGWKLSPEIAERVKFERANLYKAGDIAPLARAHTVFCRNVFIYFSPHAIRQAVATMAAKMPSGGHLFVGAAESLLRATTDYELKEVGGALAYVRL